MSHHVATLACGLDHQHEALRDLLLTREILKLAGTQGKIEVRLGGGDGACVERIAHVAIWTRS